MSKIGLFARLLPGFLVITSLAGCGGGSPVAPAAPVIIVSVSPTAATLIGGGSQTFAATVANDSANAGVTWTASAGAITSAGVYTAPSPVTATSATVTATSKTDPSKTASATVTLTPIAVSANPATATLAAGATQTFTATVTADGANAGVTWTASVGSITSGGVYTAPTPVSTATATITATSKTDTTKTGTATVTLTPIAVSVAPATATLIGGATQTFVPTVTGDATLNQGVTWTASTGTITTGGVYTAPAVITSTTATVTATSKTDPTKAGAAAVTLTPISVNAISPATISLGTGGSQAFTASVANDGSTSGVTWSIGAGVGTLTASSTNGVTYNAPTTLINSVTTVTLTATSIKDSTKSTTATITLNPISVSISPASPAAMIAGATQALTATVTGDGSSSGVTWTVTGGGSLSAASTASGVATTYTSPNPLTPGIAVVTATSVKDPSKTASATINLSVAYTVSGRITSNLLCSPGGLNGTTVSINTTPIQTTATSGSGNFSFSNVPSGTYIITPSNAGQSSIFYPSTQSVTVSGSNFTSANFSATLFNTVSGTVAYAGTQTGPIYVTLNSNCGGGTSLGTSISAPGAFTIRGVPAGPYTLQAFMDTLGKGSANASSPSSIASSLLVLSNLTGTTVTLANPAAVTLSTGPKLSSVNAFNTGALALFDPITNSSGVEMATSYTLQWSTTSSFTTIAGSKTFPANGTNQNAWFVNGLTNGSVYYFRAYGTSAGTATSPYSSTVGPITIGAPTGGNTVTGAVSFAGAATGPLYVAFLDQNTGILYGQYIASPVSAQAYSIQVPTGSNYFFIGVLDQNSDGIIDVGDISNTGGGSAQPVTVIAGPTSNQNLTLPSAAGIATITTQSYRSISSAGTTQNYSLRFQVNGLSKLPVAVTLTSGPNLVSPVDIAACAGSNNGCGQGFGATFNLYTTAPNVGDSYAFNLTYSDGTTGTLTATVTAVPNAFASNLAPQTGTSVSITPTFTWTDPINASSYTYQFSMNDSSGNTIWRIPGSNSISNGFTSSTTSIIWGTDPTAGGSTPSVGSLTLGANYSWQIVVQDINGNSAVTQVQYQP